MKFGKFLIVGSVGFLVDLAIFTCALGSATPPVLARALASVVAISFTWLANRQITFQTEQPASWSEYVKYFAVSLASASLNMAVFSLVLWLIGNLAPAYIAGAGAGLVLNYIAYGRVVFAGNRRHIQK